MGVIRESIANSTLHALPIVVTTPNKLRKTFWIATFTFAGLIVILHSAKITMRYMEKEVVTSIREFTNSSQTYPIINVRLFWSEMSEAVLPNGLTYDIVHNRNITVDGAEEVRLDTIYRINLAVLEPSTTRQLKFEFCGIPYMGVYGSIQVLDPSKDSIWTPLGLNNLDLIQGTTVIQLQPTYYRMLSEPFSSCSYEYPPWISPFNNHNLPYSRQKCELNCAIAKFTSQRCHCSPRKLTHFETSTTKDLPDCAVISDHDSRNETDLCNIDPNTWLLEEKSREGIEAFYEDCDVLCPDECERIDFNPVVTPSKNDYNDECNSTVAQGGRTFTRKKGHVTVEMARYVRIHHEQVEYPLVEYLSELIGILGAYLGISICTFAELLELTALATKPLLKKLGYRSVCSGCFQDADDEEFNKSVIPYQSPRVDTEKGKLAHENRRCSLRSFKTASISIDSNDSFDSGKV